MRKAIEGKLKAIQIEAKEIRKKSLPKILIWLFSMIFLFVIPSFNTGLAYFYIFGLVVAMIGIVYVLDTIDLLIEPLTFEEQAFKKIARAIELLEKSDENIVHEEAYRCVKVAYRKLNKVKLRQSGWYSFPNKVFNELLDNINSIILPAIAEGVMQIIDLENLALTIYENNPEQLNELNTKIKLEPRYQELKSHDKGKKSFMNTFQENKYVKILGSLVIGYGLVLLISLLYVIGTQQDFMVFAIANPEIIVLGGLGASGIAVWKIK